uniref:Uncharacterized protein n=1 Tax=Mycena chlorophos TaxID=658473 RepID=A0ABQ0LRK7_MYCCL|nr:predicted protein [Mycena chlorophos]
MPDKASFGTVNYPELLQIGQEGQLGSKFLIHNREAEVQAALHLRSLADIGPHGELEGAQCRQREWKCESNRKVLDGFEEKLDDGLFYVQIFPAVLWEELEERFQCVQLAPEMVGRWIVEYFAGSRKRRERSALKNSVNAREDVVEDFDYAQGNRRFMTLWRVVRRLLPSFSFGNHKDEYELLPESSAGHGHDSRPRARRRPAFSYIHILRWFTLRRLAVLFCGAVCLLVVAVLLSGVPPTYNDIREYERGLPQHHVAENGADQPVYLRFPGHLWGHGLNNVLQEALVMAYVAHLANRVYVFEDYTWSHLPLPYTLYDFALRPTRIPLNAFVVGPIAGGALPPPNEQRVQQRAVSAAFYQSVCPRSVVRTISAEGAPSEAEGSALVEWWVKKIGEMDGVRCVEVESDETNPVFDRFLFGSPRVLSLLPGLYASPILGAFAWSPLVHSAVARNFAVLRPTDPQALYPPTRTLALGESTSDTDHVLAGMVAVHLRRGDYKRHCPRLAQWGSGYMGVNTHPLLPDRFVIPSPANNTAKEIEQVYLEHCLPSPKQLAERLHQVRLEHSLKHPGRPPLSRVYILTNAWGFFVSSVRSLLVADGWSEVWASGDIVLDSAQAGVGMAVDMRVGEGAEVFLGNGFSSLTSNIVMLRMARGLEPATHSFDRSFWPLPRLLAPEDPFSLASPWAQTTGSGSPTT